MSVKRTPSQTIGPFFGFGLPWAEGPNAVDPATPGAIRLTGRLTDGNGEPVPDALVETWQADGSGRFGAAGFRGFARAAADRDGQFTIATVKPGAVRAADGRIHAPHIALCVFARGLLKRVVTRVYFADEEDANRADPILGGLDERSRATLLATRDAEGYRFDVRLQGDDQTVFFDLDG